MGIEVQFMGKVRPSGNAFIVTIPTAFVKGGMIPAGSRWRFKMETLNAGQGIQSLNLQDSLIHSIADEASA